MDKQEFLRSLRESLSGELPEQEVSNSIRYYEEYLVDEAGKSLADKIKELGEPRLIAKTIVDAYIVNHEGTNQKSYKRNYEESYKEKKNVTDIVMFLQKYNISINLAMKISKALGNGSVNRIEENPYILCEKIDGISFVTADSIAKNMGFSNNNVKRIKAGN